MKSCLSLLHDFTTFFPLNTVGPQERVGTKAVHFLLLFSAIRSFVGKIQQHEVKMSCSLFCREKLTDILKLLVY